jgi:hypothetical protein
LALSHCQVREQLISPSGAANSELKIVDQQPPECFSSDRAPPNTCNNGASSKPLVVIGAGKIFPMSNSGYQQFFDNQYQVWSGNQE